MSAKRDTQATITQSTIVAENYLTANQKNYFLNNTTANYRITAAFCDTTVNT